MHRFCVFEDRTSFTLGGRNCFWWPVPGHPNWPATVKYFCAGNVPLKHINHYSSQGCTLRPRHSIAYQVQCDGCDEATTVVIRDRFWQCCECLSMWGRVASLHMIHHFVKDIKDGISKKRRAVQWNTWREATHPCWFARHTPWSYQSINSYSTSTYNKGLILVLQHNTKPITVRQTRV